MTACYQERRDYLATSQDNYVFSLRALLSTHFGKTDGLSFRQGLEALTLYRAKMNEQIAAIFTLNKAESFALVEPLDGSFLLL